jgi:pantetheine-phosphate adenylyltransferase
MSPAAPSGHALFPGTFDPVTLGHLDLLRRAARLYGRLTVAVAHNATKQELLPIAERITLLREVTRDLPGVEVVQVDGLVVRACEALGARVIVRGVRSAADLEYEIQMARTNHALAPGIETVILAGAPEHSHISSTLVRQIAGLGGNLESFVPPPIAARLRPGKTQKKKRPSP